MSDHIQASSLSNSGEQRARDCATPTHHPTGSGVTGRQHCRSGRDAGRLRSHGATEDDLKLFRDAGIKVVIAEVRAEDEDKGERAARAAEL
jgi:hypothetical protein